MAKKPDEWMPLHIGEYLADTTHLTRDQHGAYLLLIMAYWRRGESLPDDDGQLAAMAKATPAEWRKMKPIIAEFFRREDGRWLQKRCEIELAAARDKVAAKSKAGTEGAKRRWQSDGRGMAEASVRQWQTDAPSTKYQEPLAAADASADESQFVELHKLLGFDGNDHKNWLAFIAMKTTNGLDYAKHILPAARYHAESGKTGNVLAYIRPKAIEIRDRSDIAAAAPVIFEDTHPEGWLERLKFWTNHPEFEAKGHRWSPKWGPIWSDPGTKVPPDILANFKAKLNGNGHATA